KARTAGRVRPRPLPAMAQLAALALAALLAGCTAPRPAPVENRSSVPEPGPGSTTASAPRSATTTPARPAPAASAPAASASRAGAPGAASPSSGQTGAASRAPAAQASPVKVTPLEPVRPAGALDPAGDTVPSLVRSDASGAAQRADAPATATTRPSVAGGAPATPASSAASTSSATTSPPAASAAAAVPGPLASAAPSAGSTEPQRFTWPASGRLLEGFSEPRNMGIAIEGQPGDPVYAVAEGKVIFSGVGPRGYGNLIIVKHENDLLSVYAHNRSLVVREGDQVTRGQKIAEIGDSDADRPKLRFEIRREGRPVDPSKYLPSRPGQ
ncbi:MAG: peptidoglycan DD-metalloendopeptidase family protein, partial [Betaproteobacteria bacterium]|nr:peptidoglycan DD-metalloendopeptidase family protein [Betaproteobacteria bacterium]